MNVDVAIIGAGFAGVSTAYHLSRRSGLSIAVLEREGRPGEHSSGRNAALVFQCVAERQVREMTARSREAYIRHAPGPGFQPLGSIQLGTRSQLEEARGAGLRTEWMTAEAVRRRVPLVEGYDFEAGLLTPSDGVMDIEKLMRFYVDGAASKGVRVLCGAEALSLSGRGPFRIETPGGAMTARRVVNAAGAWAARIARLAGLRPPVLIPMKRHLFRLEAPADPQWPFVWDLQEDFYFRPEGGGLLFSLCDESADETLDTTPSSEIAQRLAAFLKQHLPRLSGSPLTDVRACFRTHTRETAPRIGPDSDCPGFFWVAGLGGFGMGASWEIGRRAAKRFLETASA